MIGGAGEGGMVTETYDKRDTQNLDGHKEDGWSY